MLSVELTAATQCIYIKCHIQRTHSSITAYAIQNTPYKQTVCWWCVFATKSTPQIPFVLMCVCVCVNVWLWVYFVCVCIYKMCAVHCLICDCMRERESSSPSIHLPYDYWAWKMRARQANCVHMCVGEWMYWLSHDREKELKHRAGAVTAHWLLCIVLMSKFINTHTTIATLIFYLYPLVLFWHFILSFYRLVSLLFACFFLKRRGKKKEKRKNQRNFIEIYVCILPTCIWNIQWNKRTDLITNISAIEYRFHFFWFLSRQYFLIISEWIETNVW